MDNCNTVLVRCIVVFYTGIIYFSAPCVTKALENGCTITRSSNKHTIESLARNEKSARVLNCSGANLTKIALSEEGFENISSFILSSNDLIEFHVDDLKRFPNLVKLEVKTNRLQRVVRSLDNYTSTSLSYFSLTHNYLNSIPNAALRSFPNLRVLVLHHNDIRAVQRDDFRFNSKIQHLHLSNNHLTTLHDEWMTEMNLTKLSLRSCSLQNLPKRFNALRYLQYADLSSNLITDIEANSFIGCSNLQWLLLSSNKLKNIKIDAFKGASNIKMLDLSDNDIKILPEGTFDGINIQSEFIHINLNENPIHCDCSMAWFQTWIEKIKLEDTSPEILFSCYQPIRNHGKKYYEVDVNDFTCQYEDMLWKGCMNPLPVGLPSSPATTNASRDCPSKCVCYDKNAVKYAGTYASNYSSERSFWVGVSSGSSYPRVDCIDAGLSAIPDGIPADVRALHITGNNITTFHITQLKQYKELATLDLQNNGITEVVPDTSIRYPALSNLILRRNMLSSLSKKFLWSFPSLSSIEFYSNGISVIPNDMFMYNRNLQYLFAGPNPVRSFQADFVESLDLVVLSLRNTSLTSIPATIGELTNMVQCFLNDNLITTIKKSAFYKCRKLKELFLDNNFIKVIEINAFFGAASLKHIDLSENKLTTLAGNTFSNISKDGLNVELWENNFICDCKMKRFKIWIELRESFDVTSDIRFRCENPPRMQNKLSNKLTPEDFLCKKDDEGVTERGISCSSSASSIAVAVVVTIPLTLLVVLILLWVLRYYRRHPRGFNYHKQRDNTERMTVMQEMN